MADQSLETHHEEQAGAKKSAPQAKAASAGKPLGNFLLTHYTFALESDPIHAHSPKVSAPGLPAEKKYRQSFLGEPYGIEMQGTGLAEDGNYIQWAGGGRYKYGIGGAAGPPVAWKTVAVDPSVIRLGSHLIIDAYRDKGVFEAKDTGGAIHGQHIDVFAGAVDISVAYALGTKHSEVFLVSGDQQGNDHGGGGGEHAGGGNGTGGTRAPDQKKKPKGGGEKNAPSKQQQSSAHQAPTLAEVQAGHAFIRRGMQGDSVKKVQAWVHVATDGDFGPITEGAVKEFQRRNGLEVDGVVGTHTLAAFEHGGKEPAPKQPAHPGAPTHGGTPAPGGGGGGGQHNPDPPPSGGDPVAIARHFVKNPPLRADSPELKRGLPHYTAAGGATNDCADFVSSVLMTAGRISTHEINVGVMKTYLESNGWKETTKAKAQPGDVWLCNGGGISHVTLVSASGGSRIIGANGSSVEYITEEGIHYPDEIWLHKE